MPRVVRLPSVWVTEQGAPMPAIAGATTSRTAFVGRAARGPLHAPVTVGSPREYDEAFGGDGAPRPLDRALRLYFANGGREAVVVRVPDAPTGQTPLVGARRARHGLHAFDAVDDLALLCLPEVDAPSLVARAAAWCAARGAFLVTHARRGVGAAALVAARGAGRLPVTPAAGLWWPWLRDAHDGAPCAPDGAVAGVVARVDAARGVWRAAAGAEAPLRGIVGLDAPLDHATGGALNEAGICAIRELPQLGTVVWGARTLAARDDAEWRYVPVRRLATWVERSLAAGLRWAAFEPDGAPLRARIRGAVESFLLALWRAGGLVGAKPEHAFFVRCDGPPGGPLLLTVGLAPVRPGEFVLCRVPVPVAAP